MFGQQYDLAPVMRAARLFDGQPESPSFVISGVGDLEPRWKAMAAGLGNVIFTGWITRPEIGWLRQNATIGLQPYATGAPQGLANKTFEYLSAELPVVSSLDGENRQLLEESQAGIYYRNDDDSCYEAIRRLLIDKELRTTLSRNAGQVYRVRFSSEAIFGELSAALALAAATNDVGS
jgi:glycosyltransferase involved in cell wall biosynthesis